jgi:phytoene desaturase
MMSTNNPSKAPIVVIGAGVAGLAAANLLVHEGIPVRVFEINDKVGGCCATTTIDGYTFNDGALFLGLIGLLDHGFARLGLDRHELLPLRKITANSSITLPDGTVVTLGEGFDVEVAGRAVDKICLQGELRRMAEKWKPVLRFACEELLVHPFSPWRVLQKGWRHLHKLRGTVAAECNRLFRDHAVKSALSGTLLYSGLPAERMPVSTILGLVATLTEGLYLPEGGMGKVPDVLNRALINRGVPVSLNAGIDKIVIEGGRAFAIKLKNGERVDAAAVISTASGMLTFGSFIGKEHVPRSIQQQLTHARLSHQSVSIQFGLSNTLNAPAHNISVLPWMENQREIFLQDGRELSFPVYSVPTRTLPGLAAKGGSIIEMFCPVRADTPLEHWDEKRKEQLTDMCVGALRRRHDLNIAVTRVRSPKDFRDGLHLYGGALYGLSPAATPREQFSHVSPIPGLFMAGQTTFPGYGVGTAMMSGIFAAEAVARDFK